MAPAGNDPPRSVDGARITRDGSEAGRAQRQLEPARRAAVPDILPGRKPGKRQVISRVFIKRAPGHHPRTRAPPAHGAVGAFTAAGAAGAWAFFWAPTKSPAFTTVTCFQSSSFESAPRTSSGLSALMRFSNPASKSNVRP